MTGLEPGWITGDRERFREFGSFVGVFLLILIRGTSFLQRLYTLNGDYKMRKAGAGLSVAKLNLLVLLVHVGKMWHLIETRFILLLAAMGQSYSLFVCTFGYNRFCTTVKGHWRVARAPTHNFSEPASHLSPTTISYHTKRAPELMYFQ